MSDGLIVANPCRIDGAGQEHHIERPVVGPAEVWALADAVSTGHRCMVLLAGFCGLRLGEVLGLSVRHVDLLHSTLTVARQLQEIGQKGTQTFTDTKTTRGRRTLALPAVVAGELRTHIEDEEHLARCPVVHRGQGWTAAPLAVAAGVERRPLCHEEPRASLPRPPSLRPDPRGRHRATIAELQAQAGHASPAAAMRYQHATQDRSAALAELVDRVIGATPAEDGGTVRGWRPRARRLRLRGRPFRLGL